MISKFWYWLCLGVSTSIFVYQAVSNVDVNGSWVGLLLGACIFFQCLWVWLKGRSLKKSLKYNEWGELL